MAFRLSPAISCTPFERRFHHKNRDECLVASEIGAAQLLLNRINDCDAGRYGYLVWRSTKDFLSAVFQRFRLYGL